VIWRAPSPIYGLALSADNKTVAAIGSNFSIHRIAIEDGGITKLEGHRDAVLKVRFSPDGTSMLSFSNDGTVRVWSVSGQHLLRTFSQHAGVIGNAAYIDGGRHIVSDGDDGRLLMWSPEGKDAVVLFTHSAPLSSLQVLRDKRHVVVHDSSGAVWDVSTEGVSKQVRRADGADIRLLRASLDGRLLAVGTDSGVVTIYETAGYTTVLETTLPDSIRQIDIDPRNRDVVISTEAGHVRLMPLDARRSIPWRDLSVGARDVAYAPDGETIALVGQGGGSWFYSMRGDAWKYTRDHASLVLTGGFSPDGSRFVSSDADGTVVVRDLGDTFTRKAQ
jgi:WD40 repeat protein